MSVDCYVAPPSLYTRDNYRENNRQNAPYILFLSNRVSMKSHVGMPLLMLFLTLPLVLTITSFFILVVSDVVPPSSLGTNESKKEGK